jgi:lipopolysaccharide biosynthesis glycosyltransferase
MKVFVGWDSREDIAYQICKHSILKVSPTTDVVPLVQDDLRTVGLYTRDVDPLSSTEFTFTRFLIPEIMNYKGWALFCDCDIVFLEDIQKLFDQVDDKYAIMCAKHDYEVKEGTKMDGKVQHVYPRKNWSSVMLINCGHPSNSVVDRHLVNTETGKYLHRFSWLEDREIGEISHEWNWLVGVYNEPQDGHPNAIHYTEGGPWFDNYKDCEYAEVWKELLEDYNNK